MFGELQKCSDMFTKFGGHPMAAGLSLPGENIEVFRKKINENCSLNEDEMRKKVLLDAAIWISAFDEKSIEELRLFEPCGAGNPSPVFADRNNRIIRLRRIGKEGSYLKLTMADSKGSRYEAICFKDADEIIDGLCEKYGKICVDAAFAGRDTDMVMSVCYVPEINEYNGKRSIQMRIMSVMI